MHSSQKTDVAHSKMAIWIIICKEVIHIGIFDKRTLVILKYT